MLESWPVSSYYFHFLHSHHCVRSSAFALFSLRSTSYLLYGVLQSRLNDLQAKLRHRHTLVIDLSLKYITR